MKSRSFKTIILASGEFLGAVASIAALAFLARFLGVKEYATYMQALLVYSTIVPFLALGLPQTPYYFLPLHKTRAGGVIFENLVLLSTLGVVFAVIMWSGGNRLLAGLFNNPDLEKVLGVIAAYPLFMLPIMSLPACLMARDRILPIPIFNFVAKATMLALVILAGIHWRTASASVSALVLSAALVFVPGVYLMFESCSGTKLRPSASGALTQLQYSLPLGLAGLLGIVSIKINQIVVSTMCPPEEFAVYVNGAFEIPLVGILMQSVRSVLLPEFVELYKNRDNLHIKDLWQTSIVKSSCILLPVMVFFEILAPEAMRVLFSAKYEAAAVPFRILLLLLGMRCISLDVIFLASNRNRLVLVRGAVSLALNAILGVLFIRLFGYTGAAFGLVLTMYLWATPFTIHWNSKILGLSPWSLYPLGSVSRILAASLACSVLILGISAIRPLSDLPVLLISAAVYFPLVLTSFRLLGIPNIPSLRSILAGKLA